MSRYPDLPCWERLQATSAKELLDYTRAFDVDLLPTDSSVKGKPNRVMAMTMRNGRVCASEILFTVSHVRLASFSVETSGTLFWPGMAAAQMKAFGIDLNSMIGTGIVLLGQLLASIDEIQSHLDDFIGTAAVMTQEFVKLAASELVRGMADMEALDLEISTTVRPQALVMRSLFDIDKVGRRLQYHTRPGTQERKLVQELLDVVDNMIEHSQYSAKRARFHWKTASGVIEMANLSVNKIFNVLWAIIIPSNVLINWYGENFRFMPELSWWGTMPAQLLGAMVMTVLPLWLVKSSGAMR